MIVSHRHKFIFIKTKKTAGTSVELVLRAFCGPDDIVVPLRAADEDLAHGHGPRNWRLGPPEHPARKALRRVFGFPRKKLEGYTAHMAASDVRKLIGDAIWDEYFKFTIERNPWDRQVSHYFYQMRSKGRRKLSFDQFMCTKRAYLNNIELYSIDGEIAVDDVIRFENLQGDLVEVLKKIGITSPVALPRAKGGIREGDGYRSYYTEHTNALVSQWYAREIKEFGYEL